MTDVDDLIPVSEVPWHVPMVRSKHIHADTAKRWTTQGLRGVLLPRKLVGGRWMVSLKDLKKFLKETQK
jgi:hypothetical protein